MTTALLSLPGLDWLLTPIGIGAVLILLAVVFSGLLGRLVLTVERILASSGARRAAGPLSP